MNRHRNETQHLFRRLRGVRRIISRLERIDVFRTHFMVGFNWNRAKLQKGNCILFKVVRLVLERPCRTTIKA